MILAMKIWVAPQQRSVHLPLSTFVPVAVVVRLCIIALCCGSNAQVLICHQACKHCISSAVNI